jgi:putative copper export protein
MSNKTLKDENIYKKLFLFVVAVLILTGILMFALPDSIPFLQLNFENILLGVVLIISFLVIISTLNLNFSDPNDKGYVSVRKIVTIEGYDNSYKLI